MQRLTRPPSRNHENSFFYFNGRNTRGGGERRKHVAVNERTSLQRIVVSMALQDPYSTAPHWSKYNLITTTQPKSYLAITAYSPQALPLHGARRSPAKRCGSPPSSAPRQPCPAADPPGAPGGGTGHPRLRGGARPPRAPHRDGNAAAAPRAPPPPPPPPPQRSPARTCEPRNCPRPREQQHPRLWG